MRVTNYNQLSERQRLILKQTWELWNRYGEPEPYPTRIDDLISVKELVGLKLLFVTSYQNERAYGITAFGKSLYQFSETYYREYKGNPRYIKKGT